MCVVVSVMCLFAVYEISYGHKTGDLTPEQVFSNIHRQHEQFPETVIKPILQELENRPKLTSELKSKELSMKAAHETNSEIDIQPVGNSTASMKVRHAANSEFQVLPLRSDTASAPVQNTIKLGGRKVLLLPNSDLEAIEGVRQNRFHVSNLNSGLNSIPTSLNAVNSYPLTALTFSSESQPRRDNSGLNSIPTSLNAINSYPLTTLTLSPESQPRRDNSGLNSIPTSLNAVNSYPLTTLTFSSESQPRRENSGLNSIPISLNAVNSYPLTALAFSSDSQPRRDVTVLQPRTFLAANTVRQLRTRLVSNLPSVNLITRPQQVLLPRFFPRTSMGINRIEIQPANRIEIIHRQPLSAIPVSINPIVQPAPLPLLPVGPMLPVPCNCPAQPMCCQRLIRVL